MKATVRARRSFVDGKYTFLAKSGSHTALQPCSNQKVFLALNWRMSSAILDSIGRKGRKLVRSSIVSLDREEGWDRSESVALAPHYQLTNSRFRDY